MEVVREGVRPRSDADTHRAEAIGTYRYHRVTTWRVILRVRGVWGAGGKPVDLTKTE
jgi:hypothetical protein